MGELSTTAAAASSTESAAIHTTGEALSQRRRKRSSYSQLQQPAASKRHCGGGGSGIASAAAAAASPASAPVRDDALACGPAAAPEPEVEAVRPIISEARQHSFAEILRIEHHPKLAPAVLGQQSKRWTLVRRIDCAHERGDITDAERDEFHKIRLEGNKAKHTKLSQFANTQTSDGDDEDSD